MLAINDVINLDGVLSYYENVNIDKETKRRIFVDNREITEDSFFVAIVGEKFNPLSHLDKLVQCGCNLVICEQTEELDFQRFENMNFIEVKSIFDFIQTLGKATGKEFQKNGGKIIAISGSNGKTTTKEMLFHMLSRTYPLEVICTQKNNNNHLGVPFTLFQISKKTKYAIVELGSNHPGEIEHLCKMISPNIGVTTNIGDTHLEFFGDRENVFKEEAILQNYCSDTFLVNSDDELLAKVPYQNHFKSFGENGKDYSFEILGQKILINSEELKNTNISGKHNFINLGVAYALANALGLDRSQDFQIHANTFKPTANRSEWLEINGTSIFLDAYNANPSSMKASLDSFVELVKSKGETFSLILGDMNELGHDADKYHVEMGKHISSISPAYCLYIGVHADSYNCDGKYYCSESTATVSTNELKEVFSSKYVFIKGSRSLQLESILDIR